MLKIVALLNIVDTKSSKQQYLIKIEIFFEIFFRFSVTYDQFN